MVIFIHELVGGVEKKDSLNYGFKLYHCLLNEMHAYAWVRPFCLLGWVI
jgi:hypothetical protein